MPERAAQLTAFNDGIVAIDTEYVRAELDASHLIVEGGRAAFVDTGPNSGVGLLIDALHQQNLDVGDVDFVFLTHIHLDHAGGAGQLMRKLPNARCVVHPRGAPHMIDPTKLIAGTEAVYGVNETREMYGVIEPIDASRVVVPNDSQWIDHNGRQVQTVFTEGHARHHYCLYDPKARSVFTGDNFGVSYRDFDTAAGEFIFPTTTPTHFDPIEAHKSVDRIVAFEPECLFLTHYSRVTDIERLAGDLHSELDQFVRIAEAHREAADTTTAIQAALYDHVSSRLRDHGFDQPESVLRPLLGADMLLNAQGLSVWLQRMAKAG